MAAADAASGPAGWSHAPAGKKGSTAGGLASVTSMFNLGYGTNHPKFEAAKARTQSSAARAWQERVEALSKQGFEATGRGD